MIHCCSVARVRRGTCYHSIWLFLLHVDLTFKVMVLIFFLQNVSPTADLSPDGSVSTSAAVLGNLLEIQPLIANGSHIGRQSLV